MKERLAVNGVELELEIVGTGEPVLLIHGAGIADAFAPLLAEPALAGRYRLIHYHRRGYAGSSHALEPVSIAQQAADAGAVLRHADTECAHVVGHSYGGAIALQLALDAPEAVHSLALLEPALMVGATAQGYRDSFAQGRAQFRDAGAAAAVDAMWRARFGPGYRSFLDRVLPDAFEQSVADAGTAFEVELPALGEWRFGEAEARRITQPALSVLGSESNALWPRFGETHRWLLAWLAQAEPFVLPGATHALQMQNPRGLAEALAGFFARHPLPVAA